MTVLRSQFKFFYASIIFVLFAKARLLPPTAGHLFEIADPCHKYSSHMWVSSEVRLGGFKRMMFLVLDIEINTVF